jgi:RNA polymerase sigma-70 factor (ECF subfamily)
LAFDDGEAGWDESAETVRGRASAGGIGMAAAVRALPLELKEALLIVVLAGLTHREAASALDISLATLVARLTKARERISALTRVATVAETASAVAASVPHLRVVK